ncbi:hypothetical protein PFISCL1PPCAC_12525, partial [Pristionchus fissidentatus]
DHKAPEDVMKVPFEDTVATLKSLFGKKESDFELRVRFFNQKMSTCGSLDVMKFAGEVNRLYQKGNLKVITEDQMKITVFMAGLDLPNQKAMRTQLFNAVGQKPAITFKELLEKYSSLKALERDVAVVQKASGGMASNEWVHVTPRPIRLVGNDWFFKLDLKRAFFEEKNEAVVAHIKSIPEFVKNDTVYYRDRDGPNHERWSDATVLCKRGRVLYEIARSNGSTVVAHANQLRRRWVEDLSDPLSVLLESFDIDKDIVTPPPSAPTPPPSAPSTLSSPIIVLKDAVLTSTKKKVNEPTKSVENDKKINPKSDVASPRPSRPTRNRYPVNRLNIGHNSGQSY